MDVMDIIDVKAIKENDIVKFINPNKTMIDGQIKKVSNDFLGITINIRQSTYIELKKDQFIELILVYGHEAIRCSSIILGSKQSGIEQVILISIPKLILRIQRREFQRVAVVMDIEYSPLPDVAEDYKNLSSIERRYFRSFRRAHTIDISAGGVQIAIPRNEIDSKFALISLLVRDEKVIILGRKIRTDHMHDSKHNKVAFTYDDVTEKHRQLIFDFVSEKCKEINKNEMV
jgi:c-di-GMP-binding flagellar brake protein YcgR